MKQLVKLANEANSLKSYAIELESSITKIDGDNVVFPEKQSVITTMKNASQEMRQASELLDGKCWIWMVQVLMFIFSTMFLMPWNHYVLSLKKPRI